LGPAAAVLQRPGLASGRAETLRAQLDRALGPAPDLGWGR